jgi:ATP-dependent helicase HrpA
LRSLPKALRRELMPLAPKAAEIARGLQPTGTSLKQALSSFIQEKYGIQIPATAWQPEEIPQHLRPRIELIGHDQKAIGHGRDLGHLRKQLEQAKVEPARESPRWAILTQQYERFGLTGWTVGDLPESVTEGIGAERIEAWPGLSLEEGRVNLRLFRSREAAQASSLAGIRSLVEFAVQKDLAWLQKDLRALVKFDPLVLGFCTGEELQAGAYANLKSHVLPLEPFPVLSESRFLDAVEVARQRLPGLASKAMDRIELILKLRQDVLQRGRSKPVPSPSRTLGSLKDLGPAPVIPRAPSWLSIELNALVPKNFLEITPFERLPDLGRYLKALRVRSERAALNPVKDQERCRLVVPYVEALRKLKADQPGAGISKTSLEEFRWMIEEFKVSVFAQELGTSIPVSPKRLDEQLRKVHAAA